MPRPQPKSTRNATWNGGKTGRSRPPAHSPVIEQCTTEGCGETAASQPPPAGWVRTLVGGSRHPARDWCSGRCATFGIALGEVCSKSA
ncbi:hypothetical protein ACFZBU_39780 [Embleya sp. NPDC008237]|uniref:hypothetical protein n=1 Tax=Embleya sp. NPDC008237 TaxID=3363978 RepID=UPI0036E36071